MTVIVAKLNTTWAGSLALICASKPKAQAPALALAPVHMT